MATIQATAVISAVDRASPVFARVSAAAQAAAKRHEAVAASVQRAGALATAAFALPAIAGFSALIARTQDFEKALVGVKIAGIADNLKDGVVNFEAIYAQAAKTREEAMRLSKALALSPTGLLESGEAALKMGLAADKVSRLMEMAGSVHIQDREIPMKKAAEFLGTQGILFGAGTDRFPGGAGDYNADIARIANQWVGVANMTRTSASRIEEGLRQFAPLYASFGETFSNTAALIGAMVQAGQMDVESGTALKSLGTRLLKPTREGLKAMQMAGIDRSQFMDLTPVTGKVAWSNLSRMTDVQLSKGHKAALERLLLEGERGGLFQNEEFQQRLLKLYNTATGARSQDAKDRNQQRMLMSLLTGGGKIKMMDFLIDLAEKMESGKLTDAQMAHIGEGRHLSRYKALFKMLPFLKELRDKLKDVNTEFTDGGNKIWRESDAGKWEAAVASIDRALIKLRGSDGVRSLVGTFETIAEKIASLPPGVADAGGKFMVAAAGFAAFGVAVKGVAMAMRTLAGNPIMRSLLFAGATMGGLEMFNSHEKGTRPWAEMQDPQFLGENAPIVQMFNQMEQTLRSIGGLVGDVVKDIATLFGSDPSESTFVAGLRVIRDLLSEIKTGIDYARDGYRFITGKSDEGPKIDPSKAADPMSNQSRFMMWQLLFEMFKQASSGQPGKEGKNEPTKVEGTVTGQASVSVTVEPSSYFMSVIKKIERMAIGGQLGGGTGTTMPDGAPPAPPPQ